MMLFALYKQQEMSTAVLAKPEHTNECLYILLPESILWPLGTFLVQLMDLTGNDENGHKKIRCSQFTIEIVQ